MIRQLVEPRARARAKGAQVHRIYDVFAADDGMDRHRNHQRSQLADLFDKSAADLFEFVAARPLAPAINRISPAFAVNEIWSIARL